MRNKLFVLIALIATAFLFSCAGKGDLEAADIIACGTFNPETHICDKRDGNLYRITKKIDGQIWFAENLKYKPYETSSLCYGEKDENCEEYGRLYPWEEIDELCPEGWRVPGISDWEFLEDRTGKKDSDNNIKSRKLWLPYPNENGNQIDVYVEDIYNFSALPAGAYRIVYMDRVIEDQDEDCKDIEEWENWGGVTESFGRIALFMSTSVNDFWSITNEPEMKFCVAKNSYRSVRCIKE